MPARTLVRLNADDGNSLAASCTGAILSRHVDIKAVHCMSTAKAVASNRVVNESSTGAEIGMSEVFINTEYSRNPKGTTLKHDFAVMVLASNAPPLGRENKRQNHPVRAKAGLLRAFCRL